MQTATSSGRERSSEWRSLISALRGCVITPDHPDYDSARKVYNGAVDRRPRVIVRCRGAADVMACLRTARAHELPVTIRGGGHSLPGFAVCDRGLCIDLKEMRAVHVDPQRRVLTAEGGATWRDVDHEAQAFGFATTGARISSVGIGGVTLGGGYGWLMRRYGLTIDNLLAAEVVTADGEVVFASPDRHADLFWALRGGGGNFGVVTRFTYRLHRLDHPVTGGTLFYEASHAAELLAVFGELMARADDDLGALFTVLIGPSFLPPALREVPIVALSVCHVGSAQAADVALAPLRRVRPALDLAGPMPYTRLQRLFDAAGVFGNRALSRSGHLASLSADAMNTWLTHALDVPSPQSIAMLSALGGAVSRVADGETPFDYRRTAYDYAANAVWPADDDSSGCAEWATRFGEAMSPWINGCYVNEASITNGSSVPYAPSTFNRLLEVKTLYDPLNVFHHNYNIRPCGLEVPEAANGNPGEDFRIAAE